MTIERASTTENPELHAYLNENFDIDDREHIPKHGKGYVSVTATDENGIEYAGDQEVIWDYNDGIDDVEFETLCWIKVKLETVTEMLSADQILVMMSLQVKMNETVNPDWIAADYPFLRAAMMEGTEAIDHHGWKWWKHLTPDMDQLKMELVDIWHFYLSRSIVAHGENALNGLVACPGPIWFDEKNYFPSEMELVDAMQLQVGLNSVNRYSVHLFNVICDKAGLSRADLYKQYLGKNVLNMFRQANGYKEGTYDKIWSGKEDNEYLVMLLDQSPDDVTAVKLNNALGVMYRTRDVKTSTRN